MYFLGQDRISMSKKVNEERNLPGIHPPPCSQPRRKNPTRTHHTCSFHKQRAHQCRGVWPQHQTDAHRVHFTLQLQCLYCSNLFPFLPSLEPPRFRVRFSSRKKDGPLTPARLPPPMIDGGSEARFYHWNLPLLRPGWLFGRRSGGRARRGD